MSRRRGPGAGFVLACGALCALAVVLAACGSDTPGRGHASSKPSKHSSGGGKVGPATPITASSAVLSPDGSRIAAVGPKGISVWSTRDGSLEHTFGGGHVLAWSPDAKLLAVDAPDAKGTGTTIRILRATDGSVVRTVDGHHSSAPRGAASAVRALAFSPDGETLASAGYDGTVRTWAVADGAQRADIRSGLQAPSSIAFAGPDRIAVAGAGGPVEVWDVDPAKRTGTLNGVQARFVRYTSDGRFLVTTAAVPGSKPGEGLRLWEADTLRPVRAVPASVDPTSLAVDRAGRRLAYTAIGSGDVSVWPTAGGSTTKVRVQQPHAVVVGFSAGGDQVYTATGTALTGWDVATSKAITRFRSP